MCVIITVFLFFDMWVKFGLSSLPSSLHSCPPGFSTVSSKGLQHAPAVPSPARHPGLLLQPPQVFLTLLPQTVIITSSSSSQSVVSDSLQHHGLCSLTGSSVHGIPQVRILEWAVIPFSRGFSWPKDQTQVSHIAGRYFTVWTTRETHLKLLPVFKCVFLLLCIFFPPLVVLSCVMASTKP